MLIVGSTNFNIEPEKINTINNMINLKGNILETTEIRDIESYKGNLYIINLTTESKEIPAIMMICTDYTLAKNG